MNKDKEKQHTQCFLFCFLFLRLMRLSDLGFNHLMLCCGGYSLRSLCWWIASAKQNITFMWFCFVGFVVLLFVGWPVSLETNREFL